MALSRVARLTLAGVLMLSTFSFAGCGAKYESEITKQVQENCKIPDSFKKVDYKVDEKNGLAWIDYKAKNLMGVEIPNRAYFTVGANGISRVDTDDIEEAVLKDFVEKNPDKFAECVRSYHEVKELDAKVFGREKMIESLIEQAKASDNYFIVDQCRRFGTMYNRALKKAKDAYNKAPDSVKEQFLLGEAKYVKVTLEGDFFEYRSRIEWVNDYPENN